MEVRSLNFCERIELDQGCVHGWGILVLRAASGAHGKVTGDCPCNFRQGGAEEDDDEASRAVAYSSNFRYSHDLTSFAGYRFNKLLPS